ncbi:MAG: hypothetical protein HYV35_06490 [Lentisphaerae bacterium]|nr:hypothetical protein [Lentisphaerota bacterium]
MQFDDAQKDAVRRWVAEGCSLADIQKRLSNEFKLSVTFLDLRFMILDLGLKIKEQAKTTSPGLALGNNPTARTAQAAEGFEPETAGGVSVTLDRVMKPGAVVSGTVRFSDGVSASWLLDQLGRLALDARKPNYRPSPQDLEAFQSELRNLLQSRGF